MKILKNLLTVLIVLTVFSGVVNKAQAASILTFDDLGFTADYGYLTNQYDVIWDNFGYMKNTVNYFYTTDYAKGAESPVYMAMNPYTEGPSIVTATQGNTIELQSGWFYLPEFRVDGNDNNMTGVPLHSFLTINGFKSGDAPSAPSYNTTIELNNQNRVFYNNFGFNDVISLQFISSASYDEFDVMEYPNSYFTVDNINAPIPEPSSMVLGTMGLLGLLGARRRKNK